VEVVVEPRLIEAIFAARASAADAARPEVVERRHAAGFLTPRERIAALLDPGTAVEYGALAGRSETGDWFATRGGVDFVGTVDGQPVVASSTDYTDHGGGYGAGRIPRLYALAYEHRWPVILIADGGGSRATVPEARGRKGVELAGRIGRFDLFDGLAELSGWVPTIAMVSGPSYAGHASLAGFSNFLVATRGSSIGIGGPPMVEAALGIRLTHQQLASVEMHERTGGIDLLVDDEPQGIAAIRRYLSYLRDQPSGEPSPTADGIRSLVPQEGPYDMHDVVEALADRDSVFELRPNWASGLITAFARINGRTVGILANQPLSHNEGAIDQDVSDKIARFVEICNVYEYPMVALIDTPGLVLRQSPTSEAEQPGVTRHHARPLMAHHHRMVPLFSVQVRNGSGLGLYAMRGFGNGHSIPPLCLAWPTSRLDGEDPYGQPIRDKNVIDDVVDPRETRDRIANVLRLVPRAASQEKKHAVDTW
jgi:acetyl-CoA carboxylase carboxyltransferase component